MFSLKIQNECTTINFKFLIFATIPASISLQALEEYYLLSQLKYQRGECVHCSCS